MHTLEQTQYQGASLSEAKKAIIFIHGRGADSRSMMQLARALAPSPDTSLVYPEASGNTWYPLSFMAPTEQNQPFLDQAISLIDQLVDEITKNDISSEEIYFVGFSQGSCLALEYASRNAKRYGGVIVFSGGLIGPEIDRSKYPGDFSGTPIFMGCSDVDFHIPLQRLKDSTEVCQEMNAEVDLRIYPGMDHTIVQDEVEAAIKILNK